ncbi:MAG: ribonuclease HI [Bacteroidota bacterium]|nr:ribonuclease HI [Bacteroidota bacterium]
MQKKPEVIVYTDGGASGNPGPGGYGLILMSGKHKKEMSDGYRKTTNNRMELMAVIVALEALNKPCRVIIYTDSKYVADSVIKGWVFQWERKKFKKKKNPDLWMRFLQVYRKHDVVFKWVKGHANILGNERADFLAVQAYKNGSLLIDQAYEQSQIDDNETIF